MEVSLVFSAGIDPISCNNFASMLTKMATQGVKRLTIGINCNGGNVQSGIFLYNILISMPFDIVTHNIGNVDSIANAIFLAGKTRYSTRSATFMFHGVAFELASSNRLDEKRLKELLDNVSADHQRISTLIADRTGLSIDECRTLFMEQKTRAADWALEKGLIEDIREFTLPAGGSSVIFTG